MNGVDALAKNLWVLTPPSIGALIAASVFLLLIYFLILYRREQSLAGYQGEIKLENKSEKWIEKKAQELIRIEAFRLAGDLKSHLKNWEEAAELYKKGGNHLKAAQCYLSMKKPELAAKEYLANEDYEKAASLFLENKDYKNAADSFVKAGDPIKAARTYERGGSFAKAAEIYMGLGMFRKASEAYRRKDMWLRAAEALWRCYGREEARLPEDVPPTESMPLRILARQAGGLFREANKLEDAVESYKAGGWLQPMAETLEETGRISEAAEVYFQAGEVLKAADSYEKAGEHGRAAAVRAHHHIEMGQLREAVPYLVEAGEHEKAAVILKDAGEWLSAGEAFEKAGDFGEAAAMYERAERFSEAGRCMEQAGKPKDAAEYYGRAGDHGAEAQALEKAGEYIAAGNNYFERGLYDKAIAALQKVEQGDESYSEASLLLGQVFREKGMLELAREYFGRSVADQDISRGNLENFYQLAVCSERMNNLEEASRIFEKVLVLDYHYKDVADRLGAIKASRTVMETPSTPSQEDTVARPSQENFGPAPAEREERYTVEGEIGRGGMGIVYLAKDTVLERTVALKVLPASLREHPQALKNFFREAKSAARLNHPNIVTVYDAGEQAGNYYIAMELVEGETIKQIMNREGKMPLKAAVVIAGQICKALEYAHNKRIVHRDIKSSNIMWTPDKQVKIMDFGLAKVIEEVKGYQTIASGTPYYMSPEQTLGRNIDHRTDLYSLGITMFELVTGKLPFTQGDAAYHHVHTPPPKANSVDPSVPDGMSDIILKLMQKKPEERFQTAKDLFNALREMV